MPKKRLNNLAILSIKKIEYLTFIMQNFFEIQFAESCSTDGRLG